MKTNKIKNNQNSKKLIILCVSDEFFKSNFWTLEKEIISSYDICCVNYSVFYLIENRQEIKYNHLFSADKLAIEFFHRNLSEEMIDPYLIGMRDEIRNSYEIINFVSEKRFYRNSGVVCLNVFLQYGLYEEIHLIGMNLCPESGGIYPGMKRGFSFSKGKESREFKNEKNIEYAKKVIAYYGPRKKCTVYKTFEKSNIDSIPSSPIFLTKNERMINEENRFLPFDFSTLRNKRFKSINERKIKPKKFISI